MSLFPTSVGSPRSYILPDSVDSNIPHRGSIGEYGAWNVARGVLVELSQVFDVAPLSLRYQELSRSRARLPVGIRVTAEVSLPDGRRIVVIYRSESFPHGRRGDYWSVAVNGLIPAEGTTVHPSPLQIAQLVRRTMHDQ